jgi:ribosome-associated protein
MALLTPQEQKPTPAESASSKAASLKLALELARAADSKKAEEILILDISSTLAIADYFVICSARSKKQVEVVAEACRMVAKENGSYVRPLDGADSGWVVGDFMDVILHVFEEERRRYYDLEHLWADAPRVDFSPEAASRPL